MKTISPNVSAIGDGIVLRQATAADWKQLAALDQLLFGSYGAQEDPATIQARLQVFPSGCVLLEERRDSTNGDIVPELLGYLTTEKWHSRREPMLNEDPRQSHQPNGTVLNITTLAVAPAHQNRKLGGQLVAEAIAIARRENCTDIVLETAHAVSFYERHQFVKIGERVQRDIPLFIMHYHVSESEKVSRNRFSA